MNPANTARCLAAALMMAACGVAPAAAQEITRPPSGASPKAAPQAAPAEPAVKPAKDDQPAYHLDGFNLSGTNRVDTDALVATLPQHKGDAITRIEIDNDTRRIKAALAASHVHGDLTTAMLEREGKEHNLRVVWEVHLVDALSYARPDPLRHFGKQTFSGNVKLGAEQLNVATGLKAGQDMPDGSVGDARTGIEQAYDKVFPGKAVDVKGRVLLKKDHTVSIDWRIAEPH